MINRGRAAYVQEHQEVARDLSSLSGNYLAYFWPIRLYRQLLRATIEFVRGVKTVFDKVGENKLLTTFNASASLCSSGVAL